MAKLLGDPDALAAIQKGKNRNELKKIVERGIPGFVKRREPFLLYARP
jgi:hypothetical protein